MNLYRILLIGSGVIAGISFVFSLLGFMGKDIILDDAYWKASKEQRETMDKSGYRKQGAISLLLLGIANLLYVLTGFTKIPLFSYIGMVICLGDMIYLIVSWYKLKKANPIAEISAEQTSTGDAVADIPSMEKPNDFSYEENWATEIQALETEEVHKRCIDAEEEWTASY